MQECFCSLQDKLKLDPETGDIPCELIDVELCVGNNSHGTDSWISGLSGNLAFNLDHDQDGIPNEYDQDWHDWSERFNITQAEFDAWIRDYWETNFESTYGDYNDFWQDQDWSQFDISGWWDDYIEMLDKFQEAHEHDNDIDWSNLPRDADLDCPRDLNGGNISSRSFECHSVTIYKNCPNLEYPWWEFYIGYASTDVYYNRLHNYWQVKLIGKIDFSDLLALTPECDPWSSDFEQCVDYKYRLARRAALSDFIDQYQLNYDLNHLDEITGDCDLSNNFTDCVAESFFINNAMASPPDQNKHVLTKNFKACFETPNDNSLESVTICIEQPIPHFPNPYSIGGTLDGGNSAVLKNSDHLDPGHAFISLSQTIGGVTYTRSTGFYPGAQPDVFNTSKIGFLYDDNEVPYSVSLTIPITNLQCSLLLNLIDTYENQDNTYDLNDFNCTDWVISVINFSGIFELPDAYGSWPLGGGSNPGAMGEYIRSITLPAEITRDDDGGISPINHCK